MKNPKVLRIVILLGIVLASIGLDQWSKVVVRKEVEYGQHIQLIGDAFIMTKVENEGAFLSAGSDLPPIWRHILLIYLPVVVMLFVLGYLVTQAMGNKWTLAGMAFVLGGGVGNLIDRIAYGSVTDFLHIDLGFARTGVFNVADMSIMLGLGFVLISSFRDSRKSSSAADHTDEGVQPESTAQGSEEPSKD